jgi:hypothetical protein
MKRGEVRECVRVCVRERERRKCVCLCYIVIESASVCVCVCVCVCVRERERERIQFQYPRLLDGRNQFGVGTVVRPYIIRRYVQVRLLCSGLAGGERERACQGRVRAHSVPALRLVDADHVTPPTGLRKAECCCSVGGCTASLPCTTLPLHYNL